MTDRHTGGTRSGIRLMTDGGTETVTRTAHADDVVTREVDGDEQEMIRVPVSSTRPDREGDRFDRDALEDMADQIRVENPMVFDNHGLAGGYMDAIPYDSRETVGAQMDAEVESAEDGEYDLYALVNPDGTHEEGERMLRQVRDEGQPIKFSVGFRVLGYDERSEVEGEYEGEGRVFTSADLMETSRVGIPANPDASVTQAATAAKDGLPGYANHPMVQMMQAMQEGETPDEGMTAKDAVDSDTVEAATPTHVDGQGKAATDGGEKVEGGCDADEDCPEGEVCVDGECVPEDELDATPTDGKAFEDVEMASFDEYVAAHQEGASAEEVGEALDEIGEWVGGLSREETAQLVAEATDSTTGDVKDAFDDLLGDGDDGDDGGNDDDEGDTEEDDSVPDVVQDLREENDELRSEVAEIRESLNDGRGDAKTGDTQVTQNTPEPEDTDDADDEEQKDDDASNGLLFD